MAYPRHLRARDHKFFNRAAGSLTLNSTTWADLPTIGTTWDVALQGQVGDTVEVHIGGAFANEAVAVYLDVCSIVSAAPVTYIATAGGASGQGIPSCVGQASVYTYFGGTWSYVLVSGDLSSGTVTVRVRYRTSTATNKTLFAITDLPLQFGVRNRGPVDPN